MLAVIAEGPAVEATVADRRHVVGHQIAAELVALVDRHPQGAALRLPGHPHRIAQAGGEDAVTGRWPDPPPRSRRAPSSAGCRSRRRCCSSRPPRRASMPSAAGDEVLGPVMVDRPRRQVDHLDAGRRRSASRLPRRGSAARRRCWPRRASSPDQRHAEGRVEAGEEDRARLRDAVAVGVAQQDDAVRGSAGRRRPFSWNCLKNQPLMPLVVRGRSGALVSATSTSPFGST